MLPGSIRFRILVPALQPRDNALVSGFVAAPPTEAILVGNGVGLVPSPIDQQIAMARRQLSERLVDIDSLGFGNRRQQPLEVAHPVATRPGSERSLRDALVGLRHCELSVHLIPGTDPTAGGAGAVRAVEGEIAGLELLERETALGTRKMLAEGQGCATDDVDEGHALGEAECGLERIGETSLDAVLPHEPVHNHLDGVLEVAVELDVISEISHFPIDPCPAVAIFGEICKQSLVLPLAALHHRGEYLKPGSGLQIEDLINDLLGCLPGNHRPVIRAVGHPDTGE